MSDNQPERRAFSSDRRRAIDAPPHPEQIRECAGAAEFYGVDLGPLGEDAIRRILVTARAWQDRQDALEMQHARLRDRVDAWKSMPQPRADAPITCSCGSLCDIEGICLSCDASPHRFDDNSSERSREKAQEQEG